MGNEQLTEHLIQKTDAGYLMLDAGSRGGRLAARNA